MDKSEDIHLAGIHSLLYSLRIKVYSTEQLDAILYTLRTIVCPGLATVSLLVIEFGDLKIGED